MDLDGKVALVTGASRGVGAAVAVALAEQGCSVACAARSTRSNPQRTAGTLDDTLDRIAGTGSRGVAVPTDLSDRTAVEAMVRTTVDELGGLDVLINNAAVTFIGDLDIPQHRHDLVMAINLDAPLVALRTAVPHLVEGGGSVINVSSVAALYPHPGLMSYGMSKLALERMTIDAARQLRTVGVAVNCFRIDIPVASEGFIANTPGTDRSNWEPSEVAAEGILWMLRQPPSYTGHRESMFALREREGIMASRAEVPFTDRPPTEVYDGPIDVGELGDGFFVEPY